jgi:hypothetical protein
MPSERDVANQWRFDVHGQRRKLEQRLDLIRRSEKLSEGSKQTLVEFADNCLAEGLSRDRVIHYLQILQSIGERLGESVIG